jgi:Tol biopolymer transport system component
MKETTVRPWRGWLTWILIAAIPAGKPLAQVTTRVSLSSSGGQADDSSRFASVSADGRYVAFASLADNLVPNDHNGYDDIYVRDRGTGAIHCVSTFPGGVHGNGASTWPSISADGRFVAFESLATLVYADSNQVSDIYVRDLRTLGTQRVSVNSSQEQADGPSEQASISRDGRFVVFVSGASNLAPGVTDPLFHVYLRDRQNGTTELVSVNSSGAPGDASSWYPSISDDGRFVVFYGYSTNLVPGDTNADSDVFLRDRQSATTIRVSVDSNGNEALGFSGAARISGNGRFVVFASGAPNLVPGDTNGAFDIFIRDLLSGSTQLVSVASNGMQADDSSTLPSVSPDGRWVAFHSVAGNLVVNDTNGSEDVFLRDRQNGTTERVNVTSSGAQVSGNIDGFPAWISDDGRFVAFSTSAPDLVPMDTNNAYDVFVRDRDAAGFESLCDPSTSGVIACPCLNAPSGPGHGCENSSATGGASLSASGVAYLSMDSLIFTTSGELPSATSIVLQGNALAANGLVFGQGVSCADGTLKRLYTKSAVGGSISAPSGADPTVSARSATLGDTILAGQKRWYMVYYRDPNVLGGCPAASTFNATQTAQIAWSL